MRQMFQQQFRDLLLDFLYTHLRGKQTPIAKTYLKKTILTFEDMWLETLRENKKNDKRKV